MSPLTQSELTQPDLALPEHAQQALTDELERIVASATAAAEPCAAMCPEVRAAALVAIADALEAHKAELVEIAQRETGLTESRLSGELIRTAVQLRMFAEAVVDGGYLDVRIDEADPNFALGVRPDVRRYHIPIGPVVNFAASNFPFAFSVAGGDTAAALAAGCPVIVKAHSGHPELSIRTADIVAEALATAGMPDGIFQLFSGQAEGVAVLSDPRIKAGSFTGSIYAGRLLADVAAARPAPIPFFGELGSVNPVFATAAAIAEDPKGLASGYVTSVSGSAGQLCTKPGFLFVPGEHGLDASIADAASAVPEHRLLNPKIASSYAQRRAEIIETPGVRVIAEGDVRLDSAGHGWVRPTIVAVSLADLRAAGPVLTEEAFGPMSIVVEYAEGDDLAAAASGLFEGNLTATLHLSAAEGEGRGENSAARAALIRVLTQRAGRVLCGGWPTGVAVTPAMQHGGPWPATTNDSSTSVGTGAISRFLRPVAYQSMPEALLPEPLRSSNPWGVPQAFARAGESQGWTKRPRG